MIDRPNIYMFKNPMGYFFFDVNKNKVVEVDEEKYNDLIQCQKTGDFGILQEEKFLTKKEEGFLSSNKPQIIKHPYTEHVSCFLSSHIKNMVLQVTRNCNLCCRYCPYSGAGERTRTHEKKSMDWGVAQRAIDFLIERSKASQEVNIGFYGGEPLLEYPLIKKCVEYCKEKIFDKKVTFTITTNGTVMNEEIIDFLINNDFKLLISIDGPKKVHDKNRRYAINGKGSYDVVYQNLSKIREINKEFFRKITISSVIEPDGDNKGIASFFENDPLLKELRIMINPVDDTYIDENYMSDDEYQSYEESQKFKQLFAEITGKNDYIFGNAGLINEFRSTFVDLGPIPCCTHHGGVCLPGYEKTFVDINGNIRPCEKVSELSQATNIGNIYDGFDYEKVKNLLNIGQMTKEECKNCWIIRHCRECVQMIDSVEELSLEKKRQICFSQREMMKNKMNDYVYFRKLGLL